MAEHSFSYGLILIWLIAGILCVRFNLIEQYGNKGVQILGKEYYRFITALFLHSNLLHIAINAVAMYFVGKYLEPQINPVKLFLFAVFIGTVTNAVFANIYKNALSVGGSPILFALIGLIVALQITGTDADQFRLGNLTCNWILGYAIFANVPLFSTSFFSTLLMHGVALSLGILFGYIGIIIKCF